MHQVVLVVDDSMLIRHTVCRFLEERGFVVESATNGLEALEILKTIAPNIIITDLQMPRMDGYQFMEVLKSRPDTAQIPIVVLAAKQYSLEDKLASKPQHVIYKDIDIEAQLQRVLESILPPQLNPSS